MQVPPKYLFLSDKRSIDVIRKTNVMFILRGLPGSGKTYLANEIKKLYTMAKTCSADDFFLNENGDYEFDEEKLTAAHEKCEELAIRYISENVPHIIIDNTNIRKYFVKKYIHLANKCDYIALVVPTNSPWRNDPVQLAEKNSHGLTLETIEVKLKLYQEVYPLYWGWFFSDRIVGRYESLTGLAEKCFDLCICHLPHFKGFIKSLCEGAERFDAVYTRGQPLKLGRLLHSTAFYAGVSGRLKPEVVDYANSEVVKESLNKAFVLKITGIVLTPRTVGATVDLTDQQLSLFKNDIKEVMPSGKAATSEVDQKSSSSKKKKSKKSKSVSPQGLKQKDDVGSSISTEDFNRDDKSETVDTWEDLNGLGFDTLEEVSECSYSASSSSNFLENDLISVPNVSCSVTKDHSGQLPHIAELKILNVDVQKEMQQSVACGEESSSTVGDHLPNKFLLYGNRKHITIGCREGVNPVQTGIDQLDVLECAENQRIIEAHETVDGLTMEYYGEGRCYILFPNDGLYIDSIFLGRY